MSTAVTSVVPCPACGTKNRVPAAGSGRPSCGKCHEPLPWMVDASDATFDSVIRDAALPVLVDLWAPWCGPCRQISPALEKIATQMAGSLKLVKVNVDHNPATASRYDARAIPTLVILRRGEVLARRAGAAPAHDLRRWIERTLEGGAAAG